MQRNENLEKLVYQLQLLKGIADNIQQRIELINRAITELQVAAATLEGISDEKLGGSILMPIGGGSYIRARLDDVEKLIIGIGADVATEKTIGEAKVELQARILELEKVRTSLKQQFDDTSTRIDGVEREAQKAIQTASGEAGNVRRG